MSEADSKHPVTCFNDILKVERKNDEKTVKFFEKIETRLRKCRLTGKKNVELIVVLMKYVYISTCAVECDLNT